MPKEISALVFTSSIIKSDFVFIINWKGNDL